MGSKLTYTVKGPIASFRSADKAPIESLKLHFLPKQEGSGDASPQNIRPITGWTGCNLYGTGINIWDEEWELGVFSNTDGSKSYNNNTIRSKNYIPCKPSTTYYLRHPIQSNDCHLYFYDKNKTLIDHYWSWPGSFTTPSNCYYIRFYMPSAYGATYLNNIGINYPSKSSYVASVGKKEISITFPDGETIYGGYVDPVAGEIVAEYTTKIFNGSEANWSSSGDDWNTDNTGFCVPVSEFSHVSFWNDYFKSNMLKKGNNYSLSNGDFYISNQSWANFRIRMTESMTLQEFKAFLSENNLVIAYPLAIPIHIPIPSQDLKTFLDYNNFWSDMNDDTEVEYCFADRLSERKLIMNTPHIASASGSVASFNTDMKAPLEELKVHFAPVQEGTGDPSPTNIRPICGRTKADINYAGSNILDLSTLRFTTNNKAQILINNNTAVVTSLIAGNGYPNCSMEGYWDVPEAFRGKYVYFGCTSVIQSTSDEEHRSTIVCEFRDENDAFISDPTIITYGSTGSNALARNTQIPSNAAICRLYFRIAQNVSSHAVAVGDKVTFNEFYMRYPNTEHYFEDCVASVIPVKFPATKNLYDTTTYPLISSNWINGKTGATSGNDLYACTIAYVPCRDFAGKTVTMNTHLASTAKNPGIAFYDSSKTYISGITNDGTSGTSFTFAVPSDAYYMRFTVNAGTTNIQIELGSTATPYEPYGTVYGGYIDLIRGKIVATHGTYKTKFGPSNPSGVLGDYERHGYNMNVLFKSAINLHADGQGPYSLKKTFCNVAFWNWNYFGDYLHYYIDGYQAYIMLPVGTDPDMEIEFCAELATPIEYDLTPETLKSLKGQNNIFADTNGNVDVKYWTH